MRLSPTVLALAAALTLAGAPALAEAPYSFAATPGKLPKDVVPLQYAAHLVPDMAANTFLGSETVEIDVLKATSLIMLNADGIGIDAATLSGRVIGDLTLTPLIDQARQTVSFRLARPLAPGRYQLALKFHGKINREARGLFYMNYKAGGAERRMLATQMEPTDARRMLPLWDEPAFRATYKLTVDLPAGVKAYSNTPVERQEALDGGLQRIAFGVTPKMPSYLVVLVAGELERVSARQDGVDIGIVTTAGKIASADYSLNSSKDLLRYYNNYFGIPYPLAKLDQIAVPGGFNGAMENWGAIVYNEAVLLVDPKTSPEKTRQDSFAVNAHEMAHQWFGNLVTMAWWDNLWLNEGFASWMGTKATEHFHPEWQPQLDSLADREPVMNLDARKTTHPIQTPVSTEAQAANAFDGITYIKGQAFLRMLEAYLGEDAFRKGMRAYMARHKYSNTTSADLWLALEQASGKPVARLASDWTTQPGFPLVKVEQVCEGGKRKVTLSQEQFRLDEPALDKRLWHVPVQLGKAGAKAQTVMLAEQSAKFTLPGCDGTLVVDPDSVGYYRVQYDPASFAALAAQTASLSDATRLRLQSDAWGMVQAGRMDLGSYLKLASSYGDEARVAVWDAILANLRELDRLAEGEPERAQLRRYIVKLIKPKFERMGWDDKPSDSVEERLVRSRLASALADADEPGVIAEARRRFSRYLADPSSLSPSLIDVVLGVVGRNADLATHAALTERALKAQTSEERGRFVRALTRAADPALSARALALVASPELPAQQTVRMVPWIAGAGHIDQAWAFAVKHSDTLLRDQEAISRSAFFPNVVASSSNPAHADMMEKFVRDHLDADAQGDAKRVANAIRTRAALKARLLPQLRAALA